MHFDQQRHVLVGEHGSLRMLEGDEVSHKLAMLIEGECEGLGPTRAARKHGVGVGERQAWSETQLSTDERTRAASDPAPLP